jgi:hypothetical protein
VKRPKFIKSKTKRGDNNKHQEIQGIIRDYFENLYPNKLEKI